MQISQHPPFHSLYPNLGVPIKTSAAGILWQGQVSAGDAVTRQMLLPGSRAEFQCWFMERAPRWLPGCTPAAPHSTPRCPAESCRLHPLPA